jgi:MoxR-like ATPase
MPELAMIGGQTVLLADPTPIPRRLFVGRERELRLCKAAWGIGSGGKSILNGQPPLHFRLEGAPGVGKNEIVYQIARELKQPLYMIQGHEELTPEDLSLVLVPAAEKVDSEDASFRDVPLTLRASPLATAIFKGGLFFFDEINRVPERALSPLSSVLDDRVSIYSAITGMHISSMDDKARARFRFCCALNPALSETGRGVLPEYIEERTLPAIRVDFLGLDDLIAILKKNLEPSPEFLTAFRAWYPTAARKQISVRQALTLMRYAMAQSLLEDLDPGKAFVESAPHIFSATAAGGESATAAGDPGLAAPKKGRAKKKTPEKKPELEDIDAWMNEYDSEHPTNRDRTT